MKQLKITIFQQQYAYSCVAAIFQTICDFYGYEISHEDAINLLKVDKNGGLIKDAARACNKYLKTKHKSLYCLKQIENFLENGNLIIGSDNTTYIANHCNLLIGADKYRFAVLDPNTAEITLINKQEVFEGGDEFIGIYK